MLKVYRSILAALVIALGLAACPAARLSASPPAKPAIAFALVHRGGLSAPDTLIGTFQCTGAAPLAQCGIVASAVGGTILGAPLGPVNVGASGTIAILCSPTGGTVTFSGALYGIAPGYSNSAPTATVTQTLTCPAKSASIPGQFVIPFALHPGG